MVLFSKLTHLCSSCLLQDTVKQTISKTDYSTSSDKIDSDHPMVKIEIDIAEEPPVTSMVKIEIDIDEEPQSTGGQKRMSKVSEGLSSLYFNGLLNTVLKTC